MSTEPKITNLKTASRVVDRDGDEWLRREDGRYCCQALCDCTGELKPHACDEHDHFSFACIERDFGPLTVATPEESS